MKVFNSPELKNNYELAERLMVANANEGMALMDSLLATKYSNVTNDSLIKIYMLQKDSLKLSHNFYPDYWNAIVVYCQKDDKYYNLLGVEPNEFREFYDEYLIKQVTLLDKEKRNKELVSKKLKEEVSGIDFTDWINLYVIKNSKEQYPISFRVRVH